MKSRDLFLEIKKNISKLKIKKPLKAEKYNRESRLSNFNYNYYMEISNKKDREIKDEEINDSYLEDLNYRIDYFFNKYPVDDKNFKKFIKYLTLYLTFIVKKPIHPVGLIVNKKIAIFKKNNIYYCSLKGRYKKDEASLCKCCLAHEL